MNFLSVDFEGFVLKKKTFIGEIRNSITIDMGHKFKYVHV